ncbi:MAG TPA: PIG-L deacetylase family protein [Candidatus Deferrimicrobium sp.]|nr:PIG-L deacetylase family protein [Candidatus Deferrimicrobium sp.]
MTHSIGIERVLVLAPHTDDGEFGCGGSIAKFIDEGKEVYYVAFSTAEKSLPAGWPKNILETEVREATQRIGIPPANLIIYKYEVRKLNYIRQEILEELVKIKKELNPDLVFLPSSNDLHQDHTTVATEGIRAFKQISILGYELPWNNITFHTQVFIKLHETHVQKKIHALKAYNSQSQKDYASEDFIWSWAKTRGTQIGTKFAESFEIIRWIID